MDLSPALLDFVSDGGFAQAYGTGGRSRPIATGRLTIASF